MKEIKFMIEEDCELCKEGLAYLKKLFKRNKRAYANFILQPISRLLKEKRDLGEQDRIMGVVLRPDYNASGYLTHFHIEEERIKHIHKEIVRGKLKQNGNKKNN